MMVPLRPPNHDQLGRPSILGCQRLEGQTPQGCACSDVLAGLRCLLGGRDHAWPFLPQLGVWPDLTGLDQNSICHDP